MKYSTPFDSVSAKILLVGTISGLFDGFDAETALGLKNVIRMDRIIKKEFYDTSNSLFLKFYYVTCVTFSVS